MILRVGPDGQISAVNTPEVVAMGLGAGRLTRASHVLPDALPLRVLFVLLRRAFGEQGAVAAWTRGWACSWRVDLAPSGGPVLAERWTDRSEAIRREVEWLEARLAR